MNLRKILPVFGLLALVGCDSAQSKFPEAYNRYMRQRAIGNEFPVHDVRCEQARDSETAKNNVYRCYFKYMYLPWGSNTKIEKEGFQTLLNTKGTDDWWIFQN